MNVLLHVLENLICSQVDINNMQFSFMPRCSATDALYILIIKKKIYFAFVDLEKAFDWVPRSILWWAMRKWELMNGLLD